MEVAGFDLDSWKTATLKGRVEELAGALESRSKLREHVVRSIETRILEFHNKVLEIKDWPPGTQWADTQKATFFRAELDLEREKFKEYVAYWNDTVELKRELRDLKADQQKLAGLSDSPENKSEAKPHENEAPSEDEPLYLEIRRIP